MVTSEPSTSSLDPLEGQFGHLTPEQDAKFVEFKAACEKDGVYQPGKARASLDDAALLYLFRRYISDFSGIDDAYVCAAGFCERGNSRWRVR